MMQGGSTNAMDNFPTLPTVEHSRECRGVRELEWLLGTDVVQRHGPVPLVNLLVLEEQILQAVGWL